MSVNTDRHICCHKKLKRHVLTMRSNRSDELSVDLFFRSGMRMRLSRIALVALVMTLSYGCADDPEVSSVELTPDLTIDADDHDRGAELSDAGAVADLIEDVALRDASEEDAAEEDAAEERDEGPVTEPATPPNQGATSATFTIASWNANYENSVSNVISHVKQVIKADIIGFQELGSQEHAAEIIHGLAAVVGGSPCADCDYRAYFPQADRAYPDPIIWKRDKFKLIDKGERRVNNAVHTNDCPGARNDHLIKPTVWVLLEERTTGARFIVSNNHLVASVEADGQWKPCAGPIRKDLFTDHMDGIIDTVKVAKGKNIPIFITGDFNVDYRADQRPENRTAPFPYKRFSNHNIFANWHYLGMENGAGTHGNRLIDYVHMTKTPKQVKPLSQAILGKGGSDHSAVRVKVRVFKP